MARTVQGGVYVDCGDGTIVDTSTGLMWEQTMHCVAPPFDVNDVPDYTNPRCDLNTYSWSGASDSSTNIQDGTLFTQFLAQLNQDFGAAPCFANHCDWRVPKEAELATIAQQCSSVCPDPAFGPTTRGAVYYSSTSETTGSELADFAGFDGNIRLTGSSSKSILNFPRAVRGSR